MDSGLSPSSLGFLAASEHLSTSGFDQPNAFASSSTLHQTQPEEHAPNSRTKTVPTAVAGPSRKQNVACDACRAKKIRCQRNTITETCGQCLTKGSECTSVYIEQLAQRAKGTKRSKEPNGDKDAKRKRSRGEENGFERRASESGIRNEEDTFAVPQSSRRTTLASQDDLHLSQRFYHNPARPPSDLRPSEKQANLVRYLLSSQPITHTYLGYNDLSSIEQCEAGFTDLWEEQGGRVWKEDPTEAHSALTDVGIRALADDLVDTFFSLAHPRFAMGEAAIIRARLAAPDTHPEGPVPHNLLALAIAFGSRFSDHPVINADREECMGRDEAAYGNGQRPPRSRIVQMLVIRAREVIEAQKTHRIGTLNNIQVLVMTEALLAQIPFMKDRYNPYNFAAAARQISVLGYDTPRGLLAISNEKEKAAALFARWMICMQDGFRSVFHRLKPSLSETTYDLTPPEAGFVPPAYAPIVPTEDPATQTVIWFQSASAGAKMCSKISADIWNAQVPVDGVPIAALESFISISTAWRDKYLTRLGVPSEWPSSWNFDSAIAACSVDAYYHTLWLVVEHAIKDYGISELRTIERRDNPQLGERIDTIRGQIRSEAEHGAMRITGLTSVLALNHYLRLDPLVLNHPIYEAGLYLAEQGREECMASVAGLRQYCIAYPQFWPQAEEIERLYQARSKRSSAPAVPSRQTSESSGVVPLPSTPLTPISSEPSQMMSSNHLFDRTDGQEGEERDISLALFEWLHQP